MTTFEHFMVGVSIPLAMGLQKRYGWRIATLGGVSAAMPDWDALPYLFSNEIYAAAHRVWGHNLIIAALLGAAIAGIELKCDLAGRMRRFIGKQYPNFLPPNILPFEAGTSLTPKDCMIWTGIAILCQWSHLPIDMAYSGGNGLAPWPLQLLWPFSNREFSFPMVPWGDVGATMIFVLEMFALLKRPQQATSAAILGLFAVSLYSCISWYVR